MNKLKKFAAVVAICSLICSCSSSERERRDALIGAFRLHVGSDCSEENIDYARLLLRADGTYFQEGRFKNGTSYAIDAKRWRYQSGDFILLEGFRMNSAVSGPMQKEVADVKLAIDFRESGIYILLIPGQNCFFVKEPIVL